MWLKMSSTLCLLSLLTILSSVIASSLITEFDHVESYAVDSQMHEQHYDYDDCFDSSQKPAEEPIDPSYDHPVKPAEEPMDEHSYDHVKPVEEHAYDHQVRPAEEHVYDLPITPIVGPSYDFTITPIEEHIYDIPMRPVEEHSYDVTHYPRPEKHGNTHHQPGKKCTGGKPCKVDVQKILDHAWERFKCYCFLKVGDRVVFQRKDPNGIYSCTSNSLQKCSRYCDYLFEDEELRLISRQNACDVLNKDVYAPWYRRNQICGQNGSYEDIPLEVNLCCKTGRPCTR